MPMPKPANIWLRDVRGGANNADEPQSVPDDQVVTSENIDWMQGTLGGKRAGCESIDTAASVLATVMPILVSATAGGATAAASYNITVPAIANDGTGTSFLYMEVYISTKNTAQDVTNVTYLGVAITEAAVSGGTGASGRLEMWSKVSPSLAGGTVAITLAAACDSSAIVKVWRQVALSHGVTVATTTTALARASVGTNPVEVISDGVSWDTGATATGGAFQTVNGNQSNGQSRLGSSYKTADDVTTQLSWQLSSSVAWVMFINRIQGAPIASFPYGNRVAWLGRHTPTNNITEDELWLITTLGQIDRRVAGTWQHGVAPVNQYVGSIRNFAGLDINAVSLHGKYFIASVQSFHGTLVWDGTFLRWAGFPNSPPVPTIADDGGVGTFSGTRYYRTRFAQQVSGVTTRRSEPSTSVSFVPNGNDTGAVITKGTDVNAVSTEDFWSSYMNGQTHWEVEASLDNVLFYRIATVAVASATYTDTTVLATGYSANTLSDSIGENVAPHNARHVVVDDDRLVLGGNRLVPLLDSRVSWTPVASATGTGNDERVPITTGNFLDLDGLDGGGLQSLIAGESGNIYAFKWERLYKLVRTGILTSAYANQTESHTRGSTKLGICSGQDQLGNPCVYFTDPSVGLCRVGRHGVEVLGDDVLTSWETVTLSHPTAAYGPRPCYWPQKRQVWIMVKFGSTQQLLIYNARFGAGATKGFSFYKSTMLELTAEGNLIMFPGSNSVLLPILPIQTTPVLVQFNLTAVNDAGTRYRAYWLSKAYQAGELFTKFGVMAGTLFARASAATIGIGLLKNLGVARKDTTVSIAAAASETHVFKPVDNAFISECFTVQFELGDPAAYSGSQLDQTWSLNEVAFKLRREDESTS